MQVGVSQASFAMDFDPVLHVSVSVLDLAEVMLTAALTREESRGGHARRDFTTRDDEKWLKHTLATIGPDGPNLDYKGVNITNWKPVERKY